MSELNNRNRGPYAKYDNMSTEELEKILRLDLELPDCEGLDADTILYITEVIAKREPPQSEDLYPNVDQAWNTFLTKYLPHSTDNLRTSEVEQGTTQHTMQTSPELHQSRRRVHWLMRTTTIAAILAALLLATTITASAFGYDIWKVIAEWTRESFAFTSNEINNNESQQSVNTKSPGSHASAYSSLQEALDDYGIVDTSAPTWIPERFSLDSVSANAVPGFIDIGAYYSSEDTVLIINILDYKNQPQQFAQWEKDNIDPIVYEKDGTTYYLMTNMGKQKAVWITGSCECSITGDISEDELISIIDSIEGS